MGTTKYFEQPTWEHEIPGALGLYPELQAGVLNDAQIAVVADQTSSDFERLKAIGQALEADTQQDLQDFLTRQYDYQQNPEDPVVNLQNLIIGAASYAQTQEKVQRRLDDADFVHFLSPYDEELISNAKIIEKAQLLDVIASDFMLVRSQVADIQSTAGFSQWLERTHPDTALHVETLPMDTRHMVLERYHNKFTALPAPEVALPPLEPAVAARTTTVPRPHQESQDTATRWNRLSSEAKQKVIAGWAVAAVAVAMVAVVTNNVAPKESKTPVAIIGEPGTQLKKMELRSPSEIAKDRLGLTAHDAIPEKSRNAVIAKAGKTYAKRKVANTSLELGKISAADKNEVRRSINKIDEIALSSLDLLTHRPGVTPQLADTISQQVSNVMLAARYPEKQAAPITKPANSFQQEIQRLMEASFAGDPGMQHYSVEERTNVLGMQAGIINTLTPESAQGDVVDAMIAIIAQADRVLEDAPEVASPTRVKPGINEIRKKIAKLNTISPIVGSGMTTGAQAKFKAILIDAGKRYNVNPNFIASFYYVENARTGDSKQNADAAASPVAGDGNWREPAAPYGNGVPYATNQFETAGPHQFIPSTWAAYGVDANGDGNKDPNDLRDAVYGAAHFLADLGATTGVSEAQLRKAAYGYNHSETYVQSVINTYNHLNTVQGTATKRALQIQRQLLQAKENRTPAEGKKISGAVDLGMRSAFVKGQEVRTRLYAIQNLHSTSEESKPGSPYYIDGSNRNVIVGAYAAKSVVMMFRAAKADGVTLRAISSHRVNRHQKQLWNGNPDRRYVAPPRHSGHQDPRQSAIDFMIRGGTLATDFRTRNRFKAVGPHNPRIAQKSETWRWLTKNASKYGYVQYYQEPWHWSFKARTSE